MKKSPKLTSEQKEQLEKWIETTSDVKEVKRAQAVLLLDADTDFSTIYKLTRFKERAVLAFRKRYLESGLKGLEHQRKGKPKTLLTKAQRQEVIQWLETTTPKDHGYEAAYWTTSILAHLIKDKYGVIYKSKKPFYLLFEQTRFSFHKPGKVYEKRDEQKVKEWKEQVTPKLQEIFDDSETILLCEDEMILSSHTTFQKIWLKKGQYPKIEVSNTKKNRSIYGFLNIKNGRCHAFQTQRQNMYETVDMLKNIRRIYPHQKILLLWDGAGWHRGSAVMEFIQQDGKIEILPFPAYSPEENPQEHVWKKGRSQISHNKFIPDIDLICSRFVEFLNQSFFPYKLLDLAARS